MLMTCFLDMDGVLVDWVGGVKRLFGREDFPYADVRWDFDKQLGIPPARFWGEQGYEFWRGLGWTPDGRRILDAAERVFGESVAILTSPCATPGCVQGKLDWVKAHAPHLARRVFVGAAKHLLAAPDKLLVDDHDANVERFRAAGGVAVLVPRPWNSARDKEWSYDLGYGR